ncbi:hypothetical protein NDU88_003571 [Pleurodeles waltl]|uniref:Uncharacterized protein n=1 Tax=Pleurodeles waltl TaxID=8319 RepID=A0AAV7SGC5_PLEWA|nr:hypothetical protein NDU88_003571 [Pleurodeles waltl]
MPRFYGGDDASSRCQGNADAGNCLGDPDIRVPKRIEKEDRLCEQGAKEEQNADGDEENRGTKDRSNAENSEDTLEENGQPRAEKGAEERKLHHVPGGMWLTKVGKRKNAPECQACNRGETLNSGKKRKKKANAKREPRAERGTLSDNKEHSARSLWWARRVLNTPRAEKK